MNLSFSSFSVSFNMFTRAVAMLYMPSFRMIINACIGLLFLISVSKSCGCQFHSTSFSSFSMTHTHTQTQISFHVIQKIWSQPLGHHSVAVLSCPCPATYWHCLIILNVIKCLIWLYLWISTVQISIAEILEWALFLKSDTIWDLCACLSWVRWLAQRHCVI